MSRTEIRRLHRVEGMAISVIARRLGSARNTVKKALVSDGPPKYVREPRRSIVDAVEPARELLREVPDTPATVIAERTVFRVVWRDPTQPGKPARAVFDRLTPSKQKAHVLAVDGAKTEETRARRVATVCDERLH